MHRLLKILVGPKIGLLPKLQDNPTRDTPHLFNCTPTQLKDRDLYTKPLEVTAFLGLAGLEN